MIGLGTGTIDNWIFVTGVIRSGTTFTGTILSIPLEVDYIHEPFNTGCGMEGMNRRYRYVRPDPDTPEMKRLHALTTDLFDYDFDLQTVYHEEDPWYRRLAKTIVGSRGPFYLRLAKANPFHTASVIKDPTGSMMTNYLYHQFDVRPVVVVRHPVSLVASFRRLGWWPESEKLLEQSALVADHLENCRLTPSRIDSKLPVHIEDACLHWCLVNQVLLDWADRYDWTVVRHETLCEHPLSTFKRLYRTLELPWSRSVDRAVRRLTTGSSATADNNQVQDFRRDSGSIFETRLQSISKTNRREIYEVTKEVALRVYSESSFHIN
jgi:hypothetical protein